MENGELRIESYISPFDKLRTSFGKTLCWCKYAIILLFISVIINDNIAQNDRWINYDGTLRPYWKIGKNAGMLKWSNDSTLYYLKYNKVGGGLDSAYFVYTKNPKGDHIKQMITGRKHFYWAMMDTLMLDLPGLGALRLYGENYYTDFYLTYNFNGAIDTIATLKYLRTKFKPDTTNFAVNILGGDSLKLLYQFGIDSTAFLDVPNDSTKFLRGNLTWGGLVANPDSAIWAKRSWVTAQNYLTATDTINYSNVEAAGGGNGIFTFVAGAPILITDNSSHWDSAYGWGNHASAGYLTSPVSYSDLTAGGGGSGILIFSTGSPSLATNNISNWNTAYGWGNHASAGYLTSPVSYSDLTAGGGGAGILIFTAGSPSLITDNSSSWNTAYGWGNHASAGYLTSPVSYSDLTAGGGGAGILIFTAGAPSLITDNSSSWNTAYGWGNHASAGYLTSEVDGSTTNEIQTLGTSGNTITLTGGGSVTAPYATTAGTVTNGVYTTGSYSNPSWITSLDYSKNTAGGGGSGILIFTTGSPSLETNNISNWNTAYGWGNHASAGYATASVGTEGYLYTVGGIKFYGRTLTVNGTGYTVITSAQEP